MNVEAPADAVLAVSVIFARIGGLFLIAPGLSSSRIPVRVRVFLALALALALTPVLFDDALSVVVSRAPADLVGVIVSETVVGFMIGLLARILLLALSFMALAIANLTGLGVVPGLSLDESEPGQAVANLFNATAVMLIFIADLHYEVLRAAIGSYDVVSPGSGLDVAGALNSVATRYGEAFMIALRLAAPFFLYSITVNFAIGLTNKLAPQLPVFFVAMPLVTAGGLIMIALVVKEMMLAFVDAFAQLTLSL